MEIHQKLNPERTKVIACATVIEEMRPITPPGMAYEVLDFGLHIKPVDLKKMLQEAIDASCTDFDTVILGYGLCSMAIVGLTARNCTLVVPRVDDCIAIFLGSKDAYAVQANKEPGTYYLTKGWIEVSDTPFEEHKRLVDKYGQEQADRIMGIILKNYKRLAYIDTGQQDQERYHEYARMMAEKFNLRFEEIPGSDTLIRKLIFGPWDDEILVAGVALVKAPPHAPGQRLHLQRGDVFEPFPGQGALAHAAHGHHVEHPRPVDVRARLGHPVGQQVEFGLPPDQALGLQQGVGVGHVGFRRGGDVADVVEGGQVAFADLRQAVDHVGAQVGRRLEKVDDALG